MFPLETLRKVRWATCAVAAAERPIGELLDDLTLPVGHIQGTGFLIRNDVVLTNRHLVDGLNSHVEKTAISPDRRILIFIRSIKGSVFHEYYTWSKVTIIDTPEYDLALIGISGDDEPGSHEPLSFQSILDIEVGMEIGTYGYAFGSALTERQELSPTRVYRFGPVLQQGFVSAIAPYSDGHRVDRLLLDARTTQKPPCVTIAPGGSGRRRVISMSATSDNLWATSGAKVMAQRYSNLKPYAVTS